MKNWMTELALHYEKVKTRYPNDRLLLLFDIDGTILDMRYMILYLLQTYDQIVGARFFQNLKLNDIKVHEDQISPLLEKLTLQPADREKLLTWYEEHAWSPTAILQAHRPFSGVLEVVRWFQMQPNTYVGLNTGRPEVIRTDTLGSLNELGRNYKVHFTNDLLYMRANNEHVVAEAKVAGLKHFQEAGYRVFAFIDNEPDNLQAIAEVDPRREILLLHADTIFQSKRTKLPPHTVGGNKYDLTELIFEKALPQHIQFVWQGLNNLTNLGQFLASDVYWGEFDIRLNPKTGHDLILRHDSFKHTPLQKDESWLTLDYALDLLRYRQKGVLLDLKAGGQLIDRVLEQVVTYGFNGSNLWFNGDAEALQERGFRQLAAAHPGAIIQCSADFLAPLICSKPARAKEILDMLADWGINRLSINWRAPNLRQFFDQMDQWGFELNLDDAPDLEAFLQAVLLSPRSITSNFNFPKWNYYGRGTGQNGHQSELSIGQAALA
jgi:beta-phosphoglucomutase-like phosphatase (HAD superfamily)